MGHGNVCPRLCAEAAGAIAFASLRKWANAFDFALHYALVPPTSLAQQLQDKAQTVAEEQ